MTRKETIFCFRELFRVIEFFFLDGVAMSLSLRNTLSVPALRISGLILCSVGSRE
jgi:hypothetical protein